MLLVMGMSDPKIKEVQEKLQQLGYFKGTPRGNFGSKTFNAVQAFQYARSLKVDGKVGDETWGALFVPVVGTPQAATTPLPPGEMPPWLLEGLKDLQKGVKEVPGIGNNPDVVAYHQYTSLHAQDDATPWCASTACAWLERTDVRSPRSAAAADFRNWGKELPEGGQRLGCIVVMSRVGGNHVALYMDEDDTGVYMLGGNQNDKVCIRRYGWANITNFRWPE